MVMIMIFDYVYVNLDRELMLNDNLSIVGPNRNFGSYFFGKNMPK